MSAIISEKSLEIIRATTPVVKENALKITTTFYPKMLGRNPHLYKYFNETNQRNQRQAGAFSKFISGEDSGKDKVFASAQSKTLADAVIAYATNIEKLELLSETVVRITHKHCALGITPEDYKFVHDTLMEAIGEVLGDAVTPEVAAAWSEAVMALAQIFIDQEKIVYARAAEEQWGGVKEFTITDIINEAVDVKSFRMKAADGRRTCPYTPGQYITVFEKPTDKEYFAPRHYTLTSQPEDDYYQITVKRLVDPAEPENKAHDGFTSNYFHSLQPGATVHLSAAYGPDLLGAGDQAKVAAFVSVGIGMTPTAALLPKAIKTRPKVAVFHGDSTPEHHAFRRLEDNVKNAGGLWSVSYSHTDGSARLNGQKIFNTLTSAGHDPVSGVEYYVCAGPKATPVLVKQLKALGVNDENLHLEFFGPFQSTPEE